MGLGIKYFKQILKDIVHKVYFNKCFTQKQRPINT